MSSTMCAEQRKFHTSHHLLSSKKSQNLLMQLDIPPRKLLTRRQDLSSSSSPDYSPRFVDDALLLRNFLPYNNANTEDEDDPYSADHFRMFEFKVRRCSRSRSHDWTNCPFAHPGEKARRRDPRRYHYSGTVCADYRRGGCSRGDSCEFAHGVFECWLHPARYRTEACKDGKNCKRKVCFFAHTPRQLRILPVSNSRSSLPEESAAGCCGKKSSNKSYLNNSHCCLLCRSSASSSPTSTLLQAMSSSPMSSDSESKRQLVSSGSDQMHGGMMSYEDVVSELMSSLEAMMFNNNNMEAAATSSPVSSPMSSYRNNTPWVDVSPYNNAFDEAEQQFILSPSTPSPLSAGSKFFSRRGNGSTRKSLVFDEENNKAATAAGIDGDPDLGWVNDLLM